MKFSAWPETTLRYFQRNNVASMLGNGGGKADANPQVAKGPITFVNGTLSKIPTNLLTRCKY